MKLSKICKMFVIRPGNTDKYDNKKSNSPNDLWSDSKGGIYLTDPRYGNRDDMEQDGEHVYYLSPDLKKLTRVIDDLVRPNGIIGTLDGKLLYVADRAADTNYVYTINDDGTLSGRKFFSGEGSDGMALDTEGNVYITSPRNEPSFVVSVYDSGGNRREQENCAKAIGISSGFGRRSNMRRRYYFDI